MVQINGSSKQMQNGDIVTSYTDTVDPSGTTFTFPTAQETIVLKNKGTKNISYTIGGNTGTIPRSESVKLTGSFTSMLLSSEVGTQAFEVWSEESGVSSDDPVLEVLVTSLAEIATFNDYSTVLTKDSNGNVSKIELKDGETVIQTTNIIRDSSGNVVSVTDVGNGKTVTTTINRSADGAISSIAKEMV